MESLMFTFWLWLLFGIGAPPPECRFTASNDTGMIRLVCEVPPPAPPPLLLKKVARAR